MAIWTFCSTSKPNHQCKKEGQDTSKDIRKLNILTTLLHTKCHNITSYVEFSHYSTYRISHTTTYVNCGPEQLRQQQGCKNVKHIDHISTKYSKKFLLCLLLLYSTFFESRFSAFVDRLLILTTYSKVWFLSPVYFTHRWFVER